MRALFRADASVELGSGHVMRCLTLAKGLASLGVSSHFICRNQPGHLANIIRAEGFPVTLLPSPDVAPRPPWHVGPEAADADAVMASGGGDWDLVVVDHYGLGVDWERRIAPHCSRLMAIDDLMRSHATSFVLDQTPGRIDEAYASVDHSHPRPLLGPRYALLRGQFLLERAGALQHHASARRVERILLSLGGSDPTDLTSTVLRALAGLPLMAGVDVVLGSSAPHRAGVEALLPMLPYRAALHVAVADMAGLMARADLAIGTAGTTAWERCALGLPTLMLMVADNQQANASWLARHGAAVMLDARHGLSEQAILAALERMCEPDVLAGIARRAADVCDALGVGRVAAALLGWRARDDREVDLRAATLDDGEVMLAWQSHPETRRYARNPETPGRAAHFEWLAAKLADPSCLFLIIEHGGEPAGVLRLDRQIGGAYEISILVAPQRQGLGIAGIALRMLRATLPELTLEAHVLPDNQASHRLFRKLGYSWKEGRYVHQRSMTDEKGEHPR